MTGESLDGLRARLREREAYLDVIEKWRDLLTPAFKRGAVDESRWAWLEDEAASVHGEIVGLTVLIKAAKRMTTGPGLS